MLTVEPHQVLLQVELVQGDEGVLVLLLPRREPVGGESGLPIDLTHLGPVHNAHVHGEVHVVAEGGVEGAVVVGGQGVGVGGCLGLVELLADGHAVLVGLPRQTLGDDVGVQVEGLHLSQGPTVHVVDHPGLVGLLAQVVGHYVEYLLYLESQGLLETAVFEPDALTLLQVYVEGIQDTQGVRQLRVPADQFFHPLEVVGVYSAEHETLLPVVQCQTLFV